MTPLEAEKQVLAELSDPKVGGSCCRCGKGTSGILEVGYHSNGRSPFGSHESKGFFICEVCKELFDTFFTYGKRIDFKNKKQYLTVYTNTTCHRCGGTDMYTLYNSEIYDYEWYCRKCDGEPNEPIKHN